MKDLCQKSKVYKAKFPRRLKQFDGLTWLTPTPAPLFYDRSTPHNYPLSSDSVWAQGGI